MKFTGHIITLATACLLTACATTTPVQAPPQDKKLTWETRSHQLASIQSWQLNGAMSVVTPKQAGSAQVQWQQKGPNNYQMDLYGPVGMGSVKLTGHPGQVILRMANGKTTSANNPEILLQQQLGWDVPVSNLYYWVRGLPAPGSPSNKQWDAYHHITSLQQQGWNIQYKQYTNVSGIDLPKRVFMNNGPVKVRMAINQWQISR